MTKSWSPIHYYNTSGTFPIVLLCEHASGHFPEDFGDMGLSEEARNSHAAWDIGALDVAKGLSDRLNAPLAFCGASRLLYDCNRLPSADDSIPAKSEKFDVPGNENLNPEQKFSREKLIHDPFHCGAGGLVSAHERNMSGQIAVVTLHSFTPVYYGKERPTELGFLYHDNAVFSEAALGIETQRNVYSAAMNYPYSASDGVTHTLRQHGDDRGHHGTMIEIRNDLIATKDGADRLAEHLNKTLRTVAEVLKLGGETA